MPSPIHQKYSSQNHTSFNPAPSAQDLLSRSPSNPSSTHASTIDRRRSSGASAYENFANYKRPVDNPSVDARRASYADSRPKSGWIGNWWNTMTRGTVQSPLEKAERDTSTLSR